MLNVKSPLSNNHKINSYQRTNHDTKTNAKMKIWMTEENLVLPHEHDDQPDVTSSPDHKFPKPEKMHSKYVKMEDKPTKLKEYKEFCVVESNIGMCEPKQAIEVIGNFSREQKVFVSSIDHSKDARKAAKALELSRLKIPENNEDSSYFKRSFSERRDRTFATSTRRSPATKFTSWQTKDDMSLNGTKSSRGPTIRYKTPIHNKRRFKTPEDLDLTNVNKLVEPPLSPTKRNEIFFESHLTSSDSSDSGRNEDNSGLSRGRTFNNIRHIGEVVKKPLERTSPRYAVHRFESKSFPPAFIRQRQFVVIDAEFYKPEVSNDPALRNFSDRDQQLSEGNGSSCAEAKVTSPSHQLKDSMDLIETGLDCGDLITRFENLYRRKPGLTMDIAKLTKNKNRNRYGDISPYDSTRVILKNTTSPPTDTSSHNDYINASHIIMDVAGSGICNAYIASQGPLYSTSPHFWQMIWEQKSNLVVMLTTIVEQGRIKCHQYWPETDGTTDYGIFSVLCKNKDTPSSFAVREFTLTNKLTKESRTVTHMQYLAWPDHGVPQHSTDFLTFIQRVRVVRAESESTVPTVVHCSAGIGRTGVLILMETAQCLMESNQPVYPLDLVEIMRDQRPMMIQTSSQFRFVCEAICRVYSEKLTKPLKKCIT